MHRGAVADSTRAAAIARPRMQKCAIPHAIIAADSASRRAPRRRRHDRGSPEPRTFASMAVVSSHLRLPRPAAAGLSATRPAGSRYPGWLRALLLLALMLAACASRAQDSDTVTLNFVNADIDAVVKAVGEITGRNFLVDPRVKGT